MLKAVRAVVAVVYPQRYHASKPARRAVPRPCQRGPEIHRKSGLITNQGGKLSKEGLVELRKANFEKYGLSKEEVAAIALPDPPRVAGQGLL